MTKLAKDKPLPQLAGKYAKKKIVRVVFVPERDKLVAQGETDLGDVLIVTTSELIP